MKQNETINKTDMRVFSNDTAGYDYLNNPWWSNPWQDKNFAPSPWKQDWNTITYPNVITILAAITKDSLKKKLEQAKIKAKRAQLELELAQLELDEFEINNKENVKA